MFTLRTPDDPPMLLHFHSLCRRLEAQTDEDSKGTREFFILIFIRFIKANHTQRSLCRNPKYYIANHLTYKRKTN